MFIERIGWALRRILPRRGFRLLRDSYKSLRSVARGAGRRLETAVGKEELKAQLRGGGIGAGQVICVHAALSKLGLVEGGAQAVLESLQETVTDHGTVLMPCYLSPDTYQDRLDRDEIVDLRTEPSGAGKLTEALRLAPGALRSSHPFSSVCAWGKHAEFITSGHEIDPRICHPSSPLAKLLELDGLIVGLGVTLAPVSFYHVLEDTWERFPIRTYGETFHARYIDRGGRLVERPVMRYDARVAATRIETPRGEWIRTQLTDHLAQRGILTFFRYGGGTAWRMGAADLYAELKGLAERGRDHLFHARGWNGLEIIEAYLTGVVHCSAWPRRRRQRSVVGS